MVMAETTHRLHLVDTRTWEEQILKSSAHITGLVFSADGSKLYFGKPHGRPSISSFSMLTHAPPYIYIGTTEGIFELSVLEKPASLAELCVDFIRSQPHISSSTTTTTTTSTSTSTSTSSSSSSSSQLPGTNESVCSSSVLVECKRALCLFSFHILIFFFCCVHMCILYIVFCILFLIYCILYFVCVCVCVYVYVYVCVNVYVFIF